MRTYNMNQIQEVAHAFMTHQVLAFPTDTVYGVGVMYGDLNDLQRLKNAKHRPETKPIPMMVSNITQMEHIAKIDKRTKKIVQHFLPGPLTLVLPVQEGLNRQYTNGLNTVAVRIPDSSFILQVIDCIQKPLLVSSANQSGAPTAKTYRQALSQLPNIDGIVQGTCKEMQASTIVDCTHAKLKILREGPVLLSELNNI